jgi:hypothetical protein
MSLVQNPVSFAEAFVVSRRRTIGSMPGQKE